MEKSDEARVATDDNMAARCMLDNLRYTSANTCPRLRPCSLTRTHIGTHSPTRAHAHTHRCVRHCFSTATVVTRMRLNVMLCMHCLFCMAIGSAAVRLKLRAQLNFHASCGYLFADLGELRCRRLQPVAVEQL